LERSFAELEIQPSLLCCEPAHVKILMPAAPSFAEPQVESLMHLQRLATSFVRAIFFATLVLAVFAIARPAAAQQPYRILDRWKLTDAGGWDYINVDSTAHLLYITRGDHVDVLDIHTGKQVGTVSGLHAIHGVAFDTSGKYGYISDGGANAVVVFDRSTFAVIATVPAGTGPDAIIFEPATQTVWAFNGRSKDITVIDAATQKSAATIALPGRPEFPAVDGKGSVYDNLEDKSEVVRIDAHTKKITATWPAGCDSPSGLAIDTDGNRLFPVCDGKKMSVLDATSGKVLGTAAIGDGPDAAGFSATSKFAFASCGEGILSVVDASKPGYPTLESLPTQRGARTMAYDPATDRVYLVTADFGPRPPATADNPRPRAPMIPGSFTVIVVGR
jgi:YVTN family beta-propeller protein